MPTVMEGWGGGGAGGSAIALLVVTPGKLITDVKPGRRSLSLEVHIICGDGPNQNYALLDKTTTQNED